MRGFLCQWGRQKLEILNADPDHETSYYKFIYPISVSTFGYRIRTVSFYNENDWNSGYNAAIDITYSILCRYGTASSVVYTIFRGGQHLDPTSYNYQTNVDFYIIG